jgi:SAM-dependent methyltransferase
MPEELPIKDIIEWDVPNWAELVRVWQPILEQIPKTSKALAIGERNGGLALYLALMGFNVVCTDRIPDFDNAIALHHKYGIENRIQYKVFDIVHAESETAQYDIIVAKSVIGGLKLDATDRNTRNFEVQQRAVNNIHKMLKPGGYFLSAENLEGALLTRILRQMVGKSKGWRYLRHSELSLLFNKFSSVQISTFGIIPSNLPYKAINQLNFLVNKSFFSLFPASFKYIAFSVVRK